MKFKKMYKVLSLILALAMVLGAMPLSVISAAVQEEATPYVLLYSKTCKNGETEVLYPGRKSEKYGNKAVLTKDGTLWLDGYDAGPIHAFGFENFSIALKGDNTIYHDSTKHDYDERYPGTGNFLHSAIMAFNFSGAIDNPENLTIRSYSATERGNIKITSFAMENWSTTLETFGQSSFTDIRAITGNKVVLDNVNISFTVDGRETDYYGWFSARAIFTYGGLYISNSTVNGEIINTRTNDLTYIGSISGLFTWDGDTSIVNSDVNIIFDNCRSRNFRLAGIYNGGTGSINIKKSNVNVRDDSRGPRSRYSYGIDSYCDNGKENLNKSRINITDNSVVTLEGNNWDYGICDDFYFKTTTADDSTAGVTVNRSRLKISGVKHGIYTSSRGVNFVNADVDIRSEEEAVFGLDTNKSPYGLHISGSSVINLTSVLDKVVSMVPSDDYKYGRSRIELSQGGKVNFTAYNGDGAESVMPMCDFVSLGANNKVTKGSLADTLTDKETKILYAKYYGEKDSKLPSFYFSVSYVDNLNPRWYTDTGKVVWTKGVSETDEYRLEVEAAPNYGDTPVFTTVFTDKVSGNSYTLPSKVTDCLIDTVYYRIKIIPLIGNNLSETVGYSNIREAKKQVEDIKVSKSGSMFIRWDEVENATGYHYDILKYNEETAQYESCESGYQEFCNINIYSRFGKEKWFGEGKYKITVKAVLGELTTNNLLASGELSEPLEIKYHTLSYGDSAKSNFVLTVKRDSTDANVGPDKLLAGDKITLRWTGGTKDLNGWYLNSKLSGIKRTVSEDKCQIEFIMPAADVTAYPLIGAEEIRGTELWYNRTAVKTLSDVTACFNKDDYKGACIGEVQIDWYGEDGTLIADPSTATISLSENYVGNVTVNPLKDFLFTDNSVVSMFDYYDDFENACADITNSKIENGCYTFKLYLINHAVVTVPRRANGGYDFGSITVGDVAGVNNLYSFSYSETATSTVTGITELRGAKLTQLKGEALFGNTIEAEVNGNEYSAAIELGGFVPAEACFNSVPLIYSNKSVPVLNYESGTTFYADEEIETEISVVKLVDTYKKALSNQNAKVYYQVYYQVGNTLYGYGSAAKSVGLNAPIVFKTLGGMTSSKPVKITLTVWVDNGPKMTYYYYAVDALMYSQAYAPQLSVEAPVSFKDTFEVTLVNPLPNLTYYYEMDYDFNPIRDSLPDGWNSKLYNGKSIIVRESARLRIVGKGIRPTADGVGIEEYTKKVDAENLMRDYGKPLLNLKSDTDIHCTSAGTLNNVVKLDEIYLKTLGDNAKIAYQVNNGEVKYLNHKNDYFELEISETPDLNTKTKITVWVDDGEKATYTYNTCSQSMSYPIVAVPGTNTEFKENLNVRLESIVPNYDSIRYGIMDSSGKVSEYYMYDEENSIRLIRDNDTIRLYGKNSTGKTEVKLAFYAVFSDGSTSRVSTATYSLATVSDKAQGVYVNGNVFLNRENPYYVNGKASKNDDGYTAHFDADAGILELYGYSGSSVKATGNLIIRLIGTTKNNQVNGYIKCDGDLEIIGTAPLTISTTAPVDGEKDFRAIYTTGFLEISTSSTVSIDIEDHLSDDASGDIVTAAYGISAKSVLISHETSLDITIDNKKGDNYGIAASLYNIEINTTGNISIIFTCYTNASLYEHAPLYLGSSGIYGIYIKNVGYIKLAHPFMSETGSKNTKVMIMPINETYGIYRNQDFIETHSLYAQDYYTTEFIKGTEPNEAYKASVSGTVISYGSYEKPVTLELYDSDGTLCRSLTLYGNSAKYEFNRLAEGIYTLKASKYGHLAYESEIILERYTYLSARIELLLPSISGTITGFGNENDQVTVELWKKDGTSAEETFYSKGNTVYYSFNSNGRGLDTTSEYYIVVKKNNHKDYRTYDINFGSVTMQKVDIVLTVDSVRVSGSIKFEGSAAAPTITFTEDTKFDADIKEASLLLSEEGVVTDYYAILLPSTRYIMTVTAEGYQTYIAYITTGDLPIAHDIILLKVTGKLATLSGKVTSFGNESAPITVTLTLNGTSEPAYEAVINGNTAYYGFTDVPAGIYTLKAVKAGHMAWSTSFIIGYDDLRRDIKLTEIAGSYIGGTVTSYGNNEDVIIVRLVDGDDVIAYETSVYGNTADYGFYGVEDGEYTLLIIKNGHIPYMQAISVNSGDISADVILYLIGDVNGDGALDIRDLIRLKKINALSEKPAEGTTADLNGDGNTDANDLVVLRKMLLGITESKSGVTLSGTVTSYGDETADITIQLISDGMTEPAYEVAVNGNTAVYSISGIERGAYTLRAIKDNVTREYSLVIGAADVTQDINLSVLGDVNADGKVDVTDLIRMKKIAAGTAAAEAGMIADLNGDDAVNATDIAVLRKLVLGMA